MSTSTPTPPPPPPPAPGVTIAALNVITPGAGTWPVSAGMVFAQGDMPGEYLDGVQTDIKTRWPDNSAQIVLVSGFVTTAGTTGSIALGKGKPPLGDSLTPAQFKALGATVTVDAGVLGSAAFATTDWDTPAVTHISGPHCSQFIYRKAVSLSGVPDAHLIAEVRVKFYSDGSAVILPRIRNGWLLVSGPTAKPATYSVVINGSTVFGPMSLPVWHHTWQPLISGSTWEGYWIGTGGVNRTVVPKHDTAYIEGTGLPVPMLSTVDHNLPSLPSYGGVSASFTPYEPFTPENTMHSTNMGATGGADSIGLQPGWESVALADNSALGYIQMMLESYRMGQWQIHYTDEATAKPVAFSARAGVQLRIGETETSTYSLVNVYNREDYGLTSTPAIVGDNGGDPGGGGSVTNARKWARSHQPASPMLAYAMSGEYWLMEECQHVAGINFLSTPWTRSGTQFHICKPVATPQRMQVREAAWCFRNLCNAATVTSDDDPLKAEYVASVDANIDYYHDLYAPGTDMPEGLNPYGMIRFEGNGTTEGGQAWQYDFWTMAWARAVMLRVGSNTAKRTKARAFFDWVGRSIVGRAGGTGATEYLYRWIGASFAVGGVEWTSFFPGSTPLATVNWTRTPGNGPWWPNWGAYYDWLATEQGYTGGRTDGSISGGYSGDPTAWTMHAINALRMCASLGVPGAAAGMARLEASAGWDWWTSRTTGIWGGDTRPTNAFATRAVPLETLSAQSYIPPVGQRANVGLNSLADVDFDGQTTYLQAQRSWNGYAQSNSLAGMLGYSGSIWASALGPKGSIIIKGGGHGYNIGQHCYPFDLDSRRWTQIGAPRNFPADLQWAGWSNYAASSSWTAGMDQRTFSPLWYDYKHRDSYIKFDEHSYLQSVYLSPLEGGAPIKGSLLLPQTTFHQGPETSDPRTGVSVYWSPHLFDLRSGRLTRAATAPYGSWAAYTQTAAVKDTNRGRTWYLRNGGPNHFYIDTAGGAPHSRVAHTAQKVSGGNMGWTPSANATPVFVPEADAICLFYPQNSNEAPPAIVNALLGVQVFKMNGSGFPVDQERDAAVGTRAMPFGGMLVGAAWVPASKVGGVGKFYLYEGYGDDFCYTLTPSSLNFGTCTWTWGRERFTNAHTGADPVFRRAFTTADAQIFAPTGKFFYSPADGCLGWHDGPGTGPRRHADGQDRTGVVQFMNPPGAAF